MSQPQATKLILRPIGIVLFLLISLSAASLLFDQIPLSAARPPKSLKTLEGFQEWKRGKIEGKGTFENSGVTYTVMLAPAGRYLASGPSAYLFDETGQFVDWTADMGDYYTVKNRFNLTSGNVRNIEREKP
jgi:hypothetical protein